MENELEHQRIKVQLLETQATLLSQQIELSDLKLQKLEPMLRAERLTLMALQRDETSRTDVVPLNV